MKDNKYCKICGKELIEKIIDLGDTNLPIPKYNSKTGERLRQYIRYCPDVDLADYPLIGFKTSYIWERHTFLSEIK